MQASVGDRHDDLAFEPVMSRARRRSRDRLYWQHGAIDRRPAELPVFQFIRSFSIIFLGLAAGYAFNRAIDRRLLPLSRAAADRLQPLLQRIAMLGINPLAFCGAVWSLDLSDRRNFLLPIVGVSALATGLVLGLAGARLLRLPPAKAGVYATCASFTNIGNIGGLVVFVALGEAAFGLLPFYKLGEELWYYSVLFPLARGYSAKANPGSAGAAAGPAAGIFRVLRDPFFIVSLLSISLGLGLNAAGLRRPAFYAPLNAVLIPLSSFLILFAIGMRMRFAVRREHRAAAAMLIAGKALIVPCVVAALSLALGLGAGEGATALKVALVLSAMPIGFLGLVSASLNRLDLDYANSLWLASNGALILIVPLLVAILPLVG